VNGGGRDCGIEKRLGGALIQPLPQLGLCRAPVGQPGQGHRDRVVYDWKHKSVVISLIKLYRKSNFFNLIAILGAGMDTGLHIVTAICGFLAWQFVIWPIIRWLTGGVARGAVEVLRPASNASPMLFAKATFKAKGVLDAHFDEYFIHQKLNWEQIDKGIRAGTESQMMVVAQSVTALNIALQDVCYDEGCVDRMKTLSGENGFPKLRVSDDDWRRALADLWSRFSVPTRMNLDMRYRYIYQKHLNSPSERQMFAAMTHYSESSISNEFSFGAHRDTEWLGFIDNLARGEVGEARRFLEANQR
jgi:hypothetical protein